MEPNNNSVGRTLNFTREFQIDSDFSIGLPTPKTYCPTHCKHRLKHAQCKTLKQIDGEEFSEKNKGGKSSLYLKAIKLQSCVVVTNEL